MRNVYEIIDTDKFAGLWYGSILIIILLSNFWTILLVAVLFLTFVGILVFGPQLLQKLEDRKLAKNIRKLEKELKKIQTDKS